MAEITVGRVVAFYLFDVAESVDLPGVARLVGGSVEPARLALKSSSPSYIQYENPPITIGSEALGEQETHGFEPRARIYDYGVISIALSRPFTGDWSEFTALGGQFVESVDLEQAAERVCRSIAARLGPALKGLRVDWLSEDYLVLAVHELGSELSAEELLAARGAGIAGMLRGEPGPLSAQEQASILGHRISYLANDLVIPTWNAAFVYDTPAGTRAALDILEFANSQLLEFRYYDQLLDRELAGIYTRLQRPRWYEQWIGSRYTRAARQVHSLYIDLNELTDRTENAVKFIGDIYAVRLFRLAADRLALASWKADVEQKLDTMDDIYRFAVEQSGMARGQVLELTIVLILILELVLFFAGVMT
jgi:hypothetical protein